MLTHIKSDLELSAGTEIGTKLDNTLGICLDNLETQQGYIDMARELRSTGPLTAPTAAE